MVIYKFVESSTNIAPYLDSTQLIVCTSRNSDMIRIAREMSHFFSKSTYVNVQSMRERLNFFINLLYLVCFRQGAVFRNTRRILFPTPSVYNVLFAFVARLSGVSISVGLHDIVSHSKGDRVKVYLYNLACTMLANDIITFSRFSKNQYKKNISKKKSCRVFYFGTDRVYFNGEKSLDVLCFGRLRHYTGIQNLAAIAKQCPELSFHVAGRNAPQALLERIPNVSIHRTYLSDHDLFDLISRSKVVLLPYISATQSGAIPLALSLGTAVVGYDVGGLREQSHGLNCCKFVAPANAVALSGALKRMCGSEVTESHFAAWRTASLESNQREFRSFL